MRHQQQRHVMTLPGASPPSEAPVRSTDTSTGTGTIGGDNEAARIYLPCQRCFSDHSASEPAGESSNARCCYCGDPKETAVQRQQRKRRLVQGDTGPDSQSARRQKTTFAIMGSGPPALTPAQSGALSNGLSALTGTAGKAHVSVDRQEWQKMRSELADLVSRQREDLLRLANQIEECSNERAKQREAATEQLKRIVELREACNSDKVKLETERQLLVTTEAKMDEDAKTLQADKAEAKSDWRSIVAERARLVQEQREMSAAKAKLEEDSRAMNAERERLGAETQVMTTGNVKLSHERAAFAAAQQQWSDYCAKQHDIIDKLITKNVEADRRCKEKEEALDGEKRRLEQMLEEVKREKEKSKAERERLEVLATTVKDEPPGQELLPVAPGQEQRRRQLSKVFNACSDSDESNGPSTPPKTPQEKRKLITNINIRADNAIASAAASQASSTSQVRSSQTGTPRTKPGPKSVIEARTARKLEKKKRKQAAAAVATAAATATAASRVVARHQQGFPPSSSLSPPPLSPAAS